MKGSKKNQRKPVEGKNAIIRFARNSRDQAVGFVKERYTGKNAAINIARDLSMLKSLMNTEDKHIDNVYASTSVVPTAAAVIGLGTVAEGSDSSQRTGRSVKLTKLDMLLNFQFSIGTLATAVNMNQIFNWYYIRYLKTPSSSGTSAFTITDFLNADVNSNVTPMSLINDDLNEDFSVLDAGQIDISFTDIAAGSSIKNKLVELTIPVNFHQTYNGTAASNIVDNMTFFVITALNPINAGGVSNVYISSRQWYIEN